MTGGAVTAGVPAGHSKFRKRLRDLSASPPPETRIEAYLTGKTVSVWPNALVIRVDDEHGTRYVLQRPGRDDIALGREFTEARRALYAAIKHHKAGGQLPG